VATWTGIADKARRGEHDRVGNCSVKGVSATVRWWNNDAGVAWINVAGNKNSDAGTTAEWQCGWQRNGGGCGCERWLGMVAIGRKGQQRRNDDVRRNNDVTVFDGN